MKGHHNQCSMMKNGTSEHSKMMIKIGATEKLGMIHLTKFTLEKQCKYYSMITCDQHLPNQQSNEHLTVAHLSQMTCQYE